jgi:agmatinase
MARQPKIGLIGIPFDANSSYMRGPAEAPACIREALHCDSTNTSTEDGRDISDLLEDLGDVPFPVGSDPMQVVTEFVAEKLKQKSKLLALGGDHSLSYAVVRAFAERYRNLTILHFDAHPDLYEEFQGSRYSHACPFARIMEAKLARRLVQIGIRTMNDHQRRQAERFGVEAVEMKRWRGELPKLEPPLYISFDLDVLDPASAPGVSHHEPGGMTTREAIAAIQGVSVAVVGGDVVELNPRRDPLGITAMCAAKIVKEITAKMIA